MARNPYAVGKKRNSKAQVLLIENTSMVGSVPQRASFAKIKSLAKDISAELETVNAFATRMMESLRAAGPQRIEIEFGVELGAQAGIPLVTAGQATANIVVRMSWEQA